MVSYIKAPNNVSIDMDSERIPHSLLRGQYVPSLAGLASELQ
jgi:hypothetical protein